MAVLNPGSQASGTLTRMASCMRRRTACAAAAEDGVALAALPRPGTRAHCFVAAARGWVLSLASGEKSAAVLTALL